jgi:hypothetical protein
MLGHCCRLGRCEAMQLGADRCDISCSCRDLRRSSDRLLRCARRDFRCNPMRSVTCPMRGVGHQFGHPRAPQGAPFDARRPRSPPPALGSETVRFHGEPPTDLAVDSRLRSIRGVPPVATGSTAQCGSAAESTPRHPTYAKSVATFHTSGCLAARRPVAAEQADQGPMPV